MGIVPGRNAGRAAAVRAMVKATQAKQPQSTIGYPMPPTDTRFSGQCRQPNTGQGGGNIFMGFRYCENRIEVSQGINGAAIARKADMLSALSSDAAIDTLLDLRGGNNVTLVGAAAFFLTEAGLVIAAPIV